MEFTVNRNNARHITIIQQIDPKTDDVINEFYSVRKAANALNIPNLFSNIARACREGGKVKGYFWRYQSL